MITEKLIDTQNTCPVSIIRCKFNVDGSNILHVAWLRKPTQTCKNMCTLYLSDSAYTEIVNDI